MATTSEASIAVLVLGVVVGGIDKGFGVGGSADWWPFWLARSAIIFPSAEFKVTHQPAAV
jgi:hypothetical protein